MNNPLLKALEARDDLVPRERILVEQMLAREVAIAAQSDFVTEGEMPSESCLLLSGYAARYNLLEDGRRRITAIHVAGDFVDLHSLVLKPMDHSVLAVSPCRIAKVPHVLLREITATEPHLTRLLWMLVTIDAGIFRQGLVAAGRLTATGQIARFFCEIYLRLSVVGLVRGQEFDLPISQAELSDAMGLSVVQVNRSLQSLRRDGLIEWQRDKARILNWDALGALAEFDATYLNLRKIPR